MIHQQRWGGVCGEEEEEYEEERRERNLRVRILISCPANNLSWTVSEASLVS